MRPGFSRRNFLRTAAGGVLALPLLSQSRKVLGQSATFPKRLVICFSPNGTVPEKWLPTGSGASFTLGEMMSPLEAHKSDLTVIDNLTMSAALNSPSGDNHGLGTGCLLTGTELLPGDMFFNGGSTSGWPGGISLDQHIANEIGKTTKFASLEFTTKRMAGDIWSRISYAGPSLPVTPMDSPSDAFDRIFGDDSLDQTEADRRKLQGKSILDNSIAELDALRATLSKVDRDKIDAHLSALRDLESRIDISTSTSCTKPARSDLGSSKEPTYQIGAEVVVPENDLDIPDRHSAIRQMLVSSFACDLTRVASVMFAPSRSPIVMSWLGLSDSHHILSHNQDIPGLVKVQQFYAREIAKIIDDLKAIPEGDGTMFDNTLLVWCNEIGLGWTHSHDHIPFMLAGSAGGYFKTGKLVTAADGTSHNGLLISICQAMGLSDETFGDPALCNGPLPGLTT